MHLENKERPMYKRYCVLWILSLMISVNVFANDGTYFTSGNQLIPLQETSISVKKEVLTISLRDNGYADVDVYYEFYNPESATKKVKMGFEADPPYNDSYEFYADGVHPYIKNFTVEMNGVKVRHKNAVALNKENSELDFVNLNEWEFDNDDSGMTLKNKENNEILPFSYVYYFDASFKPGKNIVHHTYSYQLSIVVGTSWLLNYKLSPAARWANKCIDDFTLLIKAENTAKHFLINKETFGVQRSFTKVSGDFKIRTSKNKYNEIAPWEIALRNGVIKMHIANFKPSEEKELSIVSADEYYSYGNVDGIMHFGAFYDRSTASYLYMLEMSDSYAIVPEDKAFRQRICKNLPFAHRGHVFKDKKLKAYFESLFWYMPDPSYKDDTSDFTETDKKVMKHIIGKIDY